MTIISKNIRYLRLKNEWSQDYIAEKLGYKSYTTIQKWEMGTSEPPLKKAKQLADLFKVGIDDLTNTDLAILNQPDLYDDKPDIILTSSEETLLTDMAERIKERRLLMGFTQEELGEKLGLQKSAIAKYEKGRVENIKRSVIANMAKVLECNPAYLMGFIDESSPLYSSTLVSSEETLLTDFRNLNDDGQQKLLERAKELKDLGYVKRENTKMA